MSEAKGFGRSHLWPVAILVAVVLLSLTGRGALTSRAAADTPPVAPSDSEPETSEEPAAEQETSDDASAEEAGAEDVEEAGSEETDAEDADSGEQNVDEESDPEIEISPDEEETQPQPVEQEAVDDATPPKKEKRVIGATTTVLEKQSGLLFRARVDTGSKSCSLHVEEMVIEDEAEKWVDNIGKVVRFKVKNRSEETHWLSGRIAGYVIIKTSDTRERRYKVPLKLRWKGIEKKVLVTLNNRNGMEYPLLLGRNFLREDFLVDVDINNDD